MTHFKFYSGLACLLVMTTSTAGAQNQPQSKPVSQKAQSTFSFGGTALTLAHWRNDTDFDPSDRYDDLDGQTEGQIASFLSPYITVRGRGGVRVHYHAEIGWNAWSRNTTGQPNQYWDSAQPGLVARHREAWGEWSRGKYSVRAGFQQMRDPSRLFLDQSIGAASVTRQDGPSTVSFFVGQLADTTLEGLDVRESNFVNDSFLAGLTYTVEVGPKGTTVDSAVYTAVDERSVGRPLLLNTVVLGGRYDRRGYKAWGHILGQFGRLSNSDIIGGDQVILAWAAQLGAARNRGAVRWSSNLLLLSGDDDHHGNDHIGAFWGSGRNASQSRLLTEDEFRDRYDNFDERISTIWGAFFLNRAGLLLGEASVGYEVTKQYLPRLVVAGGMALNPKNALGGRLVGIEASLIQSYALSETARIELNCLTLIPGQAAAAMVNDVDRKATQFMYGFNVGFAVLF